MRVADQTQETAVPTLREAARLAVRLVMMLRVYLPQVLRGLQVSIATGGIGLLAPLLTRQFFDRAYPARDLEFAHVLVIGTACVGIAATLTNAVRSYFAHTLSSRIASEMGLGYFNHLLQVELAFFDKNRTGDILSRGGDLQRSIGFLTGIVQTSIVSGLYLLLVPPILLFLNWKLALLSLLATPVTTAFSLAVGQVSRRLNKRQIELAAEQSSFQLEALSSIRTVKASAAQRCIEERMREYVVATQEATLRTSALGTTAGLINSFIYSVSAALFSWVSWTLIIRGELSLGTFVAFSSYVGYVKGPVAQLAGIFTNFQQVAVSLSRFFEVFDAAREDRDEEVSRPFRLPICAKGEVEFEDVWFGYDESQSVLSGATFSIVPGTVTCFVGESGSGKSSIIKLMLRLYRPSRGTVRLDGVPIERLPLSYLRQQQAVVWQEPGLLRGTIRENILLGAKDASQEHLARAIEIAQLDQFLRSLPRGIDSSVAEWGQSLSGGQRQRIAIARALAKDASVLLLDEATANLDAVSERRFLTALLRECKGRTVVFVTHRVQTASLADRILVVKNGTVDGGFAHDEMCRASSVYSQMVEASSTLSGRDRTVGVDGTAARLALGAKV